MKRTKKLFSLALALVMTLAMAVPSFAAADDKTITVSNAVEGQTYTAYKIFDVTKTTDGSGYAYKITSTNNPVWNALTATTGGYVTVDNNGDYSGNGLILTATTENGVYNVSVNSDSTQGAVFSAADFAAWLNGVKANLTSAGSDIAEKSGDKVEAVITVTDAGYYFVDSSLGSLCALDTADAVIVYEKNSLPTIEKKVQEDANSAWGDKADADFNQIVNFKLTVNTGTNEHAPAVDPGSKDEGVDITDTVDADYTIVDTLPAGMTYVADDAATADVNEGVVVSGWAANDYTVSYDDTTKKLTIVLKKEKVATLGQNANIVITYSATLDTDAVVASAGNTNTAVLTYNTETSSDSVTVYTWNLPIYKYFQVADDPETADVNEAAKNPLANAEFKLYKEVDEDDNAETAAVKYYAVTSDAVVTDGKNVYTLTGWTTEETEGNVFVTPNSGNIIINGLDSGTYQVVETKAPDGYNKLTDPVQVIIDNNETTAIATTKIENKSGVELPSTGGMGTTIFYAVGGMMMAGAAILLVTKKKMANEE